ncbi:Uncharacterised protein [Streptococcus pneumoniae]|nr:Uncharacterised protein [Streptococcus pneumoniae]CJR70070.1 Uncharacterised protein [Streptococcus pneumoniae]COI34646.1 Uncharacterised protein [Streptococcus pneumoniae]COK98243.1 Uncharacterised protein [Streptococcus pneumoniae]COL70128.1 Uncharacterised protein [Streptococcus pneumoniae]
MSNTYRVNFMVGVIVPPNNIKQSPKFQVEVSHPKEIHLATCSPSIF